MTTSSDYNGRFGKIQLY